MGNESTLHSILRGWPWLVLAVLATLAVFYIAPHQVGVLVWSLSKISIGAYLGYWLDRSMFHQARPPEVDEPVRHHARYRRAIIIAAAMLSMGLSV